MTSVGPPHPVDAVRHLPEPCRIVLSCYPVGLMLLVRRAVSKYSSVLDILDTTDAQKKTLEEKGET